ncbi:hypothetical protein [Paenibacillus macquariensis]|uniref:hypothetical protein n=1 Tax=Paenibacillus macquariensis TaxID=948756 RepID=UPI000A67937D|nr:hypothetical protein [Paenibacillus macquariensis]MEC0089528.1 hypothetical protein [Paenibacillus macquariensis]
MAGRKEVDAIAASTSRQRIRFHNYQYLSAPSVLAINAYTAKKIAAEFKSAGMDYFALSKITFMRIPY